ncbi:MAG: hypothetical protein F6K11_34720 [Leptolyngbya sp. SIO3F4]|nr:hypothetical protein [Leptolyngbya sp. SIO3F4]
MLDSRLIPLGLLSLAIGSLSVAKPIHAANPDHVRQLLQTNSCPGCDLTDVSLKNLDLRAADLTNANLTGAQFFNTQFVQADFTGANLTDVQLFGTNLTGANLQSANLSGFNTLSLCVSNNSTEVEIEDCIGELIPFTLELELCREEYGLWKSELHEDLAEFCSSDNYIEFWLDSNGYSAYRERALVPWTTLQGANLTSANLTGANLVGVDLRYADLTNAIGIGANFSYALMLDAETIGLTDADLSSAWQTPSELGAWLIAQFTKTTEKAVATEAKITVGIINRAQQAHYLDENKFSSTFEDLQLGLTDETDRYYYRIAPLGNNGVMQYADPKSDQHIAYLGAVFVSEDSSGDYVTTVAILCESSVDTAIFAPPLPPDEPGQSPRCPENWQAL